LPTVADFSLPLLRSLAYCILFPYLLCFLIQTWVERILSPMATSVLMMNEAVFGALFGWLMPEESFSAHKLLDAAILPVCMAASILLEHHLRVDGSRLTFPPSKGIISYDQHETVFL